MKKFMVLSEVWGGIDCRMFDTYTEAKTHKMAAECGCGGKCSQIYEWNEDFGVYEFLEE